MSLKRIRTGRQGIADADTYQVGYGKPPKDHQFQPGQSGNPKGRPKGTRNFATDVKAMLKQPVRVSTDGKAKKISTQAATLMRLREKALSGDARALNRLLALAQSYNSDVDAQRDAAVSKDDATLFEVLAARLRSGAVGSPPTDSESDQTGTP
jgi:hypothetical protein